MSHLYVFSGPLDSTQFRDDTGFFAQQGLTSSSPFEATFDIATEHRQPHEHSFYMAAHYVSGTLTTSFMGQGQVQDQVFQGEPGAILSLSGDNNQFLFVLQDLSTGFDDWQVGHQVQAHCEYRNGNQLSSFDTVLTLQQISPSS